MDTRDRVKEKEELEELRNKILSEGHDNPDAAFQKVGGRCERWGGLRKGEWRRRSKRDRRRQEAERSEGKEKRDGGGREGYVGTWKG